MRVIRTSRTKTQKWKDKTRCKDRTREEGEDHECKQEATTPIDDDDDDDGDKTTATTTTIDDNNGTTTTYCKTPDRLFRPKSKRKIVGDAARTAYTPPRL